ncbi:MAG: hypothetical protein ING31_11960 [Burkholderiales bacterium]|nr:hypothetical protein [Burkholderiales bacterium]
MVSKNAIFATCLALTLAAPSHAQERFVVPIKRYAVQATIPAQIEDAGEQKTNGPGSLMGKRQESTALTDGPSLDGRGEKERNAYTPMTDYAPIIEGRTRSR